MKFSRSLVLPLAASALLLSLSAAAADPTRLGGTVQAAGRTADVRAAAPAMASPTTATQRVRLVSEASDRPVDHSHVAAARRLAPGFNPGQRTVTVSHETAVKLRLAHPAAPPSNVRVVVTQGLAEIPDGYKPDGSKHAFGFGGAAGGSRAHPNQLISGLPRGASVTGVLRLTRAQALKADLIPASNHFGFSDNLAKAYKFWIVTHVAPAPAQ